MDTPEEPVTGLGEAGGRLWDTVTAAYDLDPAELELLAQACQTADYIQLMDAVLVRERFTARGRYGSAIAHPLLAAIAEHRRLLAALLAQLKLPSAADESVPLPPEVPRLPARKAAVGQAQGV